MKRLAQFSLIFICSTCFADSPIFWDRLRHFEHDPAVCGAFLKTDICSDVGQLNKGIGTFQRKEQDNAGDDGEPILIKYYEQKQLRVFEVANTSENSDWIVNFYVLNGKAFFVVCTETYHVDQMKKSVGGDVPAEYQTPVVYSFLFTDGKLVSQYSQQGLEHPDVPAWLVSDTLKTYQRYTDE